VSDSLLDPAAEAAMGHIELGKWADLVILAPATADLIARVASGWAALHWLVTGDGPKFDHAFSDTVRIPSYKFEGTKLVKTASFL
ncbi:hypothetical protein MJL79_28440, partial [Salmonella enterica subsp. enterica serovar Montevideo]|nr:hypothetical protein [Salmonella enterica subsp. enterica serovar Montevideo]